MAAPETRYFVLWKGQQSGPFSLAQIRAQLASGEISRMHQIGEGHGWQPIDEFLARTPDEVATRRSAENAQREAGLRAEFDSRLEAEQNRHRAREAELADQMRAPGGADPFAETSPRERSPLGHLLPARGPSPSPAEPPSAPVDFRRFGAGAAPVEFRPPIRTSGLAVAAFVLALCNFVPFVNALSWIMALVFAHTALGQMDRDPALEGRGMAIAALIITYVLLVIGFILFVLLLATGARFPHSIP